MKILITGGAGFIGATVGSCALDAGHVPVILDNLVNGRREFTAGRAFYEGDVRDGALVDRVFAEHPDIAAVIHCAALAVVPDSVADPIGYYDNNVVGGLELARHLIRNGCTRLVFSSSASIYQTADDFTVTEDSPLDPQSPYAQTKAMMERVFADVSAATPLRVLSLRYFNPIGADPEMRTGLQNRRPTHALGKVIQAWKAREPFTITGTDWPTADGSGIRDYIHVWDLAAAHLAAVTRFDQVLADRTCLPINLGTGRGTTVRELVAEFNRVADRPVEAIEAGPRPGDVAGVYTRSDRAAQLLGWKAERTIADGIRDSLTWAQRRDHVLTDDA
ncbi:UDP-glucose 4-epimerase GalE [Actinomadura atramentaria]|uniref:UDP-glucose 4-epimerase GalE n=1 Tax=Actinomadura atramentaria TaxID=1990 RepID=UPI0003A73E17|nr:UDP-glucose 4-epimerase GalE [Actinomadura atramentaria]